MKLEITSKFEKGTCVKLTRRPDLGVFTITAVKAILQDTPKIIYTIKQTLWKTGSFGLEECFTLQISECELEIAENCPEYSEDGLDINLMNLFV